MQENTKRQMKQTKQTPRTTTTKTHKLHGICGLHRISGRKHVLRWKKSGETKKKGNKENHRKDGKRLAELWGRSVKAEYNTLYHKFGRKRTVELAEPATSDDEELGPNAPAEKTLEAGPIPGRRKLVLRGNGTPEARAKTLETAPVAAASDTPACTEFVSAATAVASGVATSDPSDSVCPPMGSPVATGERSDSGGLPPGSSVATGEPCHDSSSRYDNNTAKSDAATDYSYYSSSQDSSSIQEPSSSQETSSSQQSSYSYYSSEGTGSPVKQPVPPWANVLCAAIRPHVAANMQEMLKDASKVPPVNVQKQYANNDAGENKKKGKGAGKYKGKGKGKAQTEGKGSKKRMTASTPTPPRKKSGTKPTPVTAEKGSDADPGPTPVTDEKGSDADPGSPERNRVLLGCSKCRFRATGCARCKSRALKDSSVSRHR